MPTLGIGRLWRWIGCFGVGSAVLALDRPRIQCQKCLALGLYLISVCCWKIQCQSSFGVGCVVLALDASSDAVIFLRRGIPIVPVACSL